MSIFSKSKTISVYITETKKKQLREEVVIEYALDIIKPNPRVKMGSLHTWKRILCLQNQKMLTWTAQDH